MKSKDNSPNNGSFVVFMHRWCHEVADKQMSSNYLHKKIYLAISDAADDVATCWYFSRKKMMNGLAVSEPWKSKIFRTID